MSPDSSNLALVRSICEAWSQGDFSRTEWVDPEIEYSFADGPTPGTWVVRSLSWG